MARPDRVPISPPPLTELRPSELPAYVSNGLIGLRVERLPMMGGSTIVSGYSGLSPDDGVEGFAVAPYPVYGDVRVGDTWLSRVVAGARLIEIRHDFATGELTSRWRFQVDGSGVDLEHTVFCSRELPTLVVHELAVTPDRAVRLALRAGIDPAGVPGRRIEGAVVERSGEEHADARLHWESLGAVTRCGIAYATEWVGPQADRQVGLEDERGAISTTWETTRATRGTVRLRTIVSLVPSYSHDVPDQAAARLAARGLGRGFDHLRAANRAIWNDLWASRIVLDGASARWQAITDASLYYLLASVHRSTPASTSLFGLAYWPSYHYYHGHVMWDLDTFVIPPLSLLAPDAARALIDFRVRGLPGARQNAALHGQSGALFPWEASPTKGQEATPLYGPLRKDHVTLDVAVAVIRYLQATGDDKFAREGGLAIVMGAAEWAASRVRRTERGYEIDDLTGPAETTTPIANDAWTNAAAILVLRGAADMARRAGLRPPDAWQDVADRLRLPIAGRTRILRNHDDHRVTEDKGGTPSGAGAIFPLGWPAPADVETATYRFAVDEQAQRYIGTPMLSAFFGVWAARLGRRAESLELLERGYAAFIDDPFLAPDEFPAAQADKPKANPMFANLGGYLSSLLLGFPGIDPTHGEPEAWTRRDACLPAGWAEISVERLWVRGRPTRLEARHGRPARLIANERL